MNFEVGSSKTKWSIVQLRNCICSSKRIKKESTAFAIIVPKHVLTMQNIQCNKISVLKSILTTKNKIETDIYIKDKKYKCTQALKNHVVHNRQDFCTRINATHMMSAVVSPCYCA